VADLNEPGRITDEINVPGVPDPEAGPRALALKLAWLDHLAQRGRVEQAAELARS
jgi:hypothetical protein